MSDTYGARFKAFDAEQEKWKRRALAFKMWVDIHTKPDETIGFVQMEGMPVSLDALWDYWFINFADRA